MIFLMMLRNTYFGEVILDICCIMQYNYWMWDDVNSTECSFSVQCMPFWGSFGPLSSKVSALHHITSPTVLHYRTHLYYDPSALKDLDRQRFLWKIFHALFAMIDNKGKKVFCYEAHSAYWCVCMSLLPDVSAFWTSCFTYAENGF